MPERPEKRNQIVEPAAAVALLLAARRLYVRRIRIALELDAARQGAYLMRAAEVYANAVRRAALMTQRHVRSELRRIGAGTAAPLGEVARADAFRIETISRLTALQNDLVATVAVSPEATRPAAVAAAVSAAGERSKQLSADLPYVIESAALAVYGPLLGIDDYYWVTARDDRVRPGHARLDGTRQRWDSPPDVGGGRRLHAGQDYRCRCRAALVLPLPR